MAYEVRKRVGMGMALVLVVILVLGFMIMRGKMQNDLWEISSLANRAYPESNEPVEALLVWIQAPHHTLTERNRGVWALGQLRDPRALPVLQEYFHGGECDHENELCQRELKKAIANCQGKGLNLMRLSLP